MHFNVVSLPLRFSPHEEEDPDGHLISAEPPNPDPDVFMAPSRHGPLHGYDSDTQSSDNDERPAQTDTQAAAEQTRAQTETPQAAAEQTRPTETQAAAEQTRPTETTSRKRAAPE